MTQPEFIAKGLKNKVAIITGAGQGIGEQIALDLADYGAKVVAVDLNQDSLFAVKNKIESSGGQCLALQGDISSSNQVNGLIRKTVEVYGSVDLLVNNAGITSHGTIEDATDELIDKILAVNLKGTIYTIRAAVPIMKKNCFGRIVNVSSIAGKRGDNTTTPCYGASKGGEIAITKSLARQLGPFGITVNAVAPHAIMTPMMRYWDENKKKRAIESLPVRRLGTPKDVSAAVLFLLSDSASFITGEVININGGFFMD